MLTKLRAHLSYANVVSTLCLFTLLGGGAYAATKLPKNSVGAAQIKANAIGSSEVKNHSLLATDFKAGQLPAGARGPAGADGALGAPGTPGSPGTARAYGFVSSAGVVDSARSKNLTATKITSQDGAYCVRPSAGSGVDPTTVLPVVTADLRDGAFQNHVAQISSAPFYSAQCPAAAGWEVYTMNEDNASKFLTPTDVAFSVVVP